MDSMDISMLTKSKWVYVFDPECYYLIFKQDSTYKEYNCELDYFFEGKYKISKDSLFLIEYDLASQLPNETRIINTAIYTCVYRKDTLKFINRKTIEDGKVIEIGIYYSDNPFYFVREKSDTASCCNANIVLIPKQQSIVLYKRNNYNDTLDYIINDTISENYFVGTIYDMKNEFSFVRGSYVQDTTEFMGWIETKYLGIYLMMGDKIPLYSEPKPSSTKIFINNPEWYPLEIIKCDRKWLYIKYKDKNQERIGWLSPEFQCPNPYTTCN
jgi:hypothetical protein